MKPLKNRIDNQSIVFTDKSTSYVDISDFVELHIAEKSDKETTNETLNGFILPSVTRKKIYWEIIIKSKESIYNYISTSLSTN